MGRLCNPNRIDAHGSHHVAGQVNLRHYGDVAFGRIAHHLAQLFLGVETGLGRVIEECEGGVFHVEVVANDGVASHAGLLGAFTSKRQPWSSVRCQCRRLMP